MRDSRNLTDQIEGFDPPTYEQQVLARKTVCAFSFDAKDADLLLRMLGIHPLEQADEHIPVAMVSHLHSVAM